ncbi:hypothetical protein SeLEV6574_g05244 [Synchytrium endobioticum]|uniref:Uncharacterized protein n=2 Tax=Synchytrium endobioticum TaxID=286115 RepID=A0A507CVF7_9FUNG|nr:hypothetical protein SeLEV6574_g05244 [Synchytrium endobioticum]
MREKALHAVAGLKSISSSHKDPTDSSNETTNRRVQHVAVSASTPTAQLKPLGQVGTPATNTPHDASEHTSTSDSLPRRNASFSAPSCAPPSMTRSPSTPTGPLALLQLPLRSVLSRSGSHGGSSSSHSRSSVTFKECCALMQYDVSEIVAHVHTRRALAGSRSCRDESAASRTMVLHYTMSFFSDARTQARADPHEVAVCRHNVEGVFRSGSASTGPPTLPVVWTIDAWKSQQLLTASRIAADEALPARYRFELPVDSALFLDAVDLAMEPTSPISRILVTQRRASKANTAANLGSCSLATWDGLLQFRWGDVGREWRDDVVGLEVQVSRYATLGWDSQDLGNEMVPLQ